MIERNERVYPAMNEKNITKKEINKFLDLHPDKDFSAAKFQYSLYLDPEIENLARENVKSIARTETELQTEVLIRETTAPEELLRFMRKELTKPCQDVLREKLLQMEAEMLPLIQKKSLTNKQSIFIEHAVYFLLRCKTNCCDWIIKEYSNIHSEYLKSSLCLVLGFHGTLKCVPFLMQATEQFEKHYPDKDYEQAPLLALQELCVRFLD